MRVELEFVLHLLQLLLLLALPLLFLRRLELLERTDDENLGVGFDVFLEGLLVLDGARGTLRRGFMKFILPYSMLKIL